MKMDRMKEWLENRGFDAEMSYDSTMKAYRFKITRGDCGTVKFFKYPNGCDMVHVDRIQREFLENAVRSFESNTKDTSTDISRCPICGRHPNMTLTVTLDDLLDDDANKISCCGYTFTASSREECLRKWNQHVENRNKLMNGFMFNDSIGIQKEVEFMNNYMVNDAIKTATAYAELDSLTVQRCAPQIKKVHFNNPVTVIIWNDGTKTLVRTQDGEVYDPEKGMALAIAKKFLGNKGNYYNVFDKYLSELEKVDCKGCPSTDHGRKTECTWNMHKILCRDCVGKMKEFLGVKEED